MQQYYLNEVLEEIMILSGKIHHYLNNVVKIKRDEEIILFNNNQKVRYLIVEIKKEAIKAQKQEELTRKKEQYTIDIAFGLLKKDKVETVIRKTTELGVNNVYLLNLQNNVMKITSQKELKKIARYKEIAISASEQCKRWTIPEIYYIKSKEVIEYEEYQYIYLLHEKEENNLLTEKLLEIPDYKNKKILIISGPEGGFTKEELEFFKKHTSFVSINDNILRAETAVIVGVGIIKAILN